MGFRSWLASILTKTGETEIDVSTWRNTETSFVVNAYAIFTVVDFIASLMTKIEFQTYYNGTLVHALEWHRLNYRPNRNQSGSQFWREFWSKLLYEQEVLVVSVGEERIIADSYTHHPEYGVGEDVFEQVTRGDLTLRGRYPMSDVFYLQYSNTQAAAAIGGVLDLYSRLIAEAVEEHRRDSGERGILNINAAATGPEDFEARYGKWINTRFKSYFNGRNAVMPLYRGMTYTGKTGAGGGSVKDINSMLDAAISRAAIAYKIPPTLMRGDVAGVGDVVNLALTACIDPLALMAAREITAKEFTPEQVVAGCRVAAFTNRIKHTDLFDAAPAFDKLFAAGFSYNDLCRLLDLPQSDERWADEHHITKNYGLMEGGEQHE
jgi:HK97 family phage portal protein